MTVFWIVQKGSLFQTALRADNASGDKIDESFLLVFFVPAVFDFHQSRFAGSDITPVLFGGDFNAVPHTDKGKSPASVKLLGEGFTDAYRSFYPDVEKHPGFSHRGGRRIDQLYYKGKGLKNISTKVVSSWPTGFPSDHYLIISKFVLNYWVSHSNNEVTQRNVREMGIGKDKNAKTF